MALPSSYDQLVLTGDGVLQADGSVEVHPDLKKPYLKGTLVIPAPDEVRAVMQSSPEFLQVIGRSGQSQAGIEVKMTGNADFKSKAIEVPVEVIGLLGEQHGRILEVIKGLSGTDLAVEMGRLLHANPEQALNGRDIRNAIQGHRLMLPENAKILEEGVVELPLSDLHYMLCLDNLTHEDDVLRFLNLGKHGLNDVRDEDPRPLPEHLRSGEYHLGATHISIGPYTAVLEPGLAVNGKVEPRVFHLAARILDGIRTTGIDVPRQLEIYNSLPKDVNMKDLKVRLRIYPGSEVMNKKARRLINPRTIREGVKLSDVLGLDAGPETFIQLMNLVSARPSSGKPHGYILSRARNAQLDWRPTPALQEAGIRNVAAGLMANKKGYKLNGAGPDLILDVSRRLSDVGAEQDQGTLMISHAFPDPSQMEILFQQGVGGFVATDLRWSPDMFLNADPNASESAPRKYNDLYFDWLRYAQFRQLERKGALLHMVFPALSVDQGKGHSQKIPPHVREFHRGFWVRPEEKDRLNEVDTIIAMYGSHVNGVDDILAPQLAPFMRRMRGLFGRKAAITHGKGPGLMQAADEAAAADGIFRIGVGIGVEKLGQAPNFAPEAMVDFIDKDRLPRQKLMDDLATIKIFNIGGAGTLEEAAITLCSQKLGKNIVTPMIFVDPVGLKGGEHLFTSLKEQIDVMVAEHLIPVQDAEATTARLLAAYNAGYLHLVNSYDEVGDIINGFVSDPIGYYEERGIPYDYVRRSWETAQETFAETGFANPHFFPQQLLDLPETRRRLSPAK